jgi:putative ABC transport system substrate-binding protein
MNRREVVLAFLALGATPLRTVAQQSGGVPRIGYFMERAGPTAFDEAFLEGLRLHGYKPGQNIAIEYRWADGRAERLQRLAQELVTLRVDVLVTAGAPATLAAKRATTTIPIVMASSQDAVADGLVVSLAKPGGNVTGESVFAAELSGKRLEILKEAIPKLSRVGVLYNAANPGNPPQYQRTKAAAQVLGLQVKAMEAHIPDDLEKVFADAAKWGAGAVVILSDSATIPNRSQIAAAAAKNRLATMFANKAYLEGGGLMSYGPDILDAFRHAASYVDKILKGARPADLPVQQPTKFELVINGKTAKALGIKIPKELFLRADQVID